MLSMTNNNNYFSLEGKFLIASPNMTDPRFIKSLIYMISDDIKGSMGIIINKPALDLDMSHFLNNYERLDNKNNNHTVFYGGPVEFDKGFVLHTNDYKTSEDKTLLKNNLVLSSNIKILKDLSIGNGPSKFIVVIGYAGWQTNQLAQELKQNSWLVANMNKKNTILKKTRIKMEKMLSIVLE